MRVLILAAHVEEAKLYARSQRWQYSEWRFVSGLSDLIGCAAGARAPRALELPGAREHRHYPELRRALDVRNARWLPILPPKVDP